MALTKNAVAVQPQCGRSWKTNREHKVYARPINVHILVLVGKSSLKKDIVRRWNAEGLAETLICPNNLFLRPSVYFFSIQLTYQC